MNHMTIFKKDSNIMKFLGILKDLDWNKKINNMKKLKKSLKNKIKS